MAGKNDFLIFDENRENLLSQEVYINDQARTDGFKKGLARSNVNNKVLHQTSKMCHALGELIKDNGNIASDESTSQELKFNLETLFRSFSGENGYVMFDIVHKDHLLSYKETKGLELLGNYVYKESISGSRYGYPDFYNKCLEEKNAGTVTEITLGGNPITIYVNSNGHQFYNIEDKGIIDVFYNSTGTAWFYGVDTANERVLLPRNDYYFKNGGTDEVGNNIEAGLPQLELTNEADVVVQTGGNIPAKTGSVQIAGNKIGSGGGTTAYSNTSAVGFNLENNTSINTSSSTPSEIVSKNSIYGNSETVQPASVSVLAYMVVGNTAVESAITNIIEVTTSENDTIPLFHNFWSKEDMTTTGCYVNASLGSWLSGNIYTTAYNTLVQKLGTGNVKAVSDTYTDYDFVVNADDMTFRLPLKNGQEIMFATCVKGNGMALGFTNGTAYAGLQSIPWVSGVTESSELKVDDKNYGLSVGTTGANNNTSSAFNNRTIVGITDQSEYSGIILDIENITIPEGWNLYYKVSNAVQNIELLDVAGVTADLNKKISKEECPRYVVEVSDKSLLPSWYVVYNDGWCEQGGYFNPSTQSNTITFLKTFINTEYSFNYLCYKTGAAQTGGYHYWKTATTSSITTVDTANTVSSGTRWEAKGYIK